MNKTDSEKLIEKLTDVVDFIKSTNEPKSEIKVLVDKPVCPLKPMFDKSCNGNVCPMREIMDKCKLEDCKDGVCIIKFNLDDKESFLPYDNISVDDIAKPVLLPAHVDIYGSILNYIMFFCFILLLVNVISRLTKSLD
jgi:hypothetical protein